MTTMSAEWHEFPIKNLFPRMGRVRSTEEIFGTTLVRGGAREIILGLLTVLHRKEDSGGDGNAVEGCGSESALG